MNLRQLLALATASILSFAASAQSVSMTPEGILMKLRATFTNTPFSEVRATPITGIYEVVMGKDIAYTDSTARYFVFGNVMDMQTQRNLTQERRAELTKVDPTQLKLADAIKTVHGDGSRVLYVFSDPECPYCKKLEPELAGVNNVTIYTFLYPVLGDKSNASAVGVWCSKDRNKAWADHMLRGAAMPSAACDNPIQRNVAAGSAFGITGTPTLISASGALLPGAMPADRIEAFLAEGQGKAATKVSSQ